MKIVKVTSDYIIHSDGNIKRDSIGEKIHQIELIRADIRFIKIIAEILSQPLNVKRIVELEKQQNDLITTIQNLCYADVLEEPITDDQTEADAAYFERRNT